MDRVSLVMNSESRVKQLTEKYLLYPNYNRVSNNVRHQEFELVRSLNGPPEQFVSSDPTWGSKGCII